MVRRTRSDDWGFPRWRPYGSEREAVKVRTCDMPECNQPGTFKAPKSPWSDEKYLFCQAHVTEYNQNYDYFRGLSDEEAKQRAHDEARTAAGYRNAAHWAWAQDGADGLTPGERDAYRALELEPDASEEDIKKAYRKLAKQYHPDTAGTSAEVTAKFHAVLTAYEILTARSNAMRDDARRNRAKG